MSCSGVEVLEQIGQSGAQEGMHDGEHDRSNQYEQCGRRFPSVYDEAEGSPRGGRVLGIRQDHNQGTEADRQHRHEIASEGCSFSKLAKPRYEVQSGKRRTDNYPDDVSADNPLRMRCLAMWPHEYNEGAGCNSNDDRGPEHHVDDQQDEQQRQRGQCALEEIVLPVTPEFSVDQPALQQKEAD